MDRRHFLLGLGSGGVLLTAFLTGVARVRRGPTPAGPTGQKGRRIPSGARAEASPAPEAATTRIALDAGSAVNVSGKNDVEQLKILASGVGWEFRQTPDTTAGLKKIGIKTIRCINVDPLPGHFDAQDQFIVDNPAYLLANLASCRATGANPHIIIAQQLHPDVKKTRIPSPAPDGAVYAPDSDMFQPTTSTKFQNYCRALFEYVLIEQGFPHASFEVGNEPDIDPSFDILPRHLEKGSASLYKAYLAIYRNVAIAARAFELNHNGYAVRLGGPATTLPFTTMYGAFNWPKQFMRDCSTEHLKLDFIGVHYYGNQSSFHGEYTGNYPSLANMIALIAGARDTYCPGTPIWFTEWGASSDTSNNPAAKINGNQVGAAWTAAFLTMLLDSKVDGALYLVTTDLAAPANGKLEDVWGWPSLFVNPDVFGKALPKAPYHVFEMISQLAGSRIRATSPSATVGCFASIDRAQKKVTALVWNYGYHIPEQGDGIETALKHDVHLLLPDAPGIFGSRDVLVERWLVDETTSNAYHLFSQGKPVDEHANLQKVDTRKLTPKNGALDVEFTVLPSSVSLVVLS